MNGHRGVMEMHGVFKNLADGTMAVVAVMYEIGRGSRFLDRLIDAGPPAKSGDEIHSHHVIDLADGLTILSHNFRPLQERNGRVVRSTADHDD